MGFFYALITNTLLLLMGIKITESQASRWLKHFCRFSSTGLPVLLNLATHLQLSDVTAHRPVLAFAGA